MTLDTEDKLVNFKVFLDVSERIRFKVACTEERTTMSQKAKELITHWLEERELKK
jgi:hypothetical protein